MIDNAINFGIFMMSLYHMTKHRKYGRIYRDNQCPEFADQITFQVFH